ncbi:MAG TPA: lytic transglycosylase domain-containing protein [Acidobacteriaceae bacterium]|nr:lytic transglycosylase domain-containing protein [Acidobacteriaceae bacterium]
MPTHCTSLRRALTALALTAFACVPLRAAEQITLRNGSQFLCTRQEQNGDRVRLYLYPASRADLAQGEANYIEISAASVLSTETVPNPPLPAPPDQTPAAPASSGSSSTSASASAAPLTPQEMRQLLARAGSAHHIDADLLAAVVHAESNGNPHAISRVGARGLMQLMPATAAAQGVHDSFAPDQNVSGGTAYLDQLLTHYHDNVALALAAYNAGPEAVDRYHGIPPYAETRAYVARIIREFNRRKLAEASTDPAATAGGN